MLNAVFSCPRCGRPIGDIPPRGRLVAVCAKCRLKYEVLHTHVVDGTVQEIVVRQETQRYRGSVAQRYALRVELPTGRREEIEFQLPDDEPRIAILPGDVLYLVFLMRGDSRDALLTVDNATSGKTTILALPTDVGAKKATVIGAVVGLVAIFGLSAVGADGLVAIAAGLGAFICIQVGLPALLTPSSNVSPEEMTDLDATQRLLWEKLRLESCRKRAVRALDDQQESRARLTALREKMANVGAQLYERRIATIDSATSLLDSQMEISRKLAQGYERSIQMIEIELEAGAATASLPVEAGPNISAALDEMRALEEEQAELARQVSANDEVDALLNGNRELGTGNKSD